MLEVAINQSGDAIAYADAVLYEPHPGYKHGPAQIHAMSVIGPEQSIRAIAATCAMRSGRIVHFGGANKIVHGVWAGDWRARSQTLSSGLMHLVAMPEPDFAQVEDDDDEAEDGKEKKKPADPEHVVMPSGAVDASAPDWLRKQPIWRDVYYRLMGAYTTPMIPLDHPGQDDAERAVSYEWCRVLVGAIVKSRKYWRPLELHPDQTDMSWQGSGILTIKQGDLDSLVSRLVRGGHLRFPESEQHAQLCGV